MTSYDKLIYFELSRKVHVICFIYKNGNVYGTPFTRVND